MKVEFWHTKIGSDSIKTEFPIGSFKREWMCDWNISTIFKPFIHAPKMGVSQIEFQFVDKPCHKRQLFGRPDGSTNTDRIISGRLSPGTDIFKRLGKIKIFK